MALRELLNVSEVVHGCLRAAAPLTKHDGICTGAELREQLTALLAIRVLDWAFRRVEIERPAAVLRLAWRTHTSQLLWTFLSTVGINVQPPSTVVRDFTVQVVLPIC